MNIIKQMSSEFLIDLYENGFSIQSNQEKFLLKGIKWQYNSWEQEEGSIFVHVSTNSKIFLLILKNNQCSIQDENQFFMSITVPHMVFQILKNHVLELSKK